MTTHFECQSIQRGFYKQSTPSCHLCSTLPQHPMGPGLAWPEGWPSGKHPSLWSWSWDKDSCQMQHRGPRSRAGCHSLLGKARVLGQTEARGPKMKPRPRPKRKDLRKSKSGAGTRSGWEKASLSWSRWPIGTEVGVWGLNRMGLLWRTNDRLTSLASWHTHNFLGQSYFSEVIRKVTIFLTLKPLPRWTDLTLECHSVLVTNSRLSKYKTLKSEFSNESNR